MDCSTSGLSSAVADVAGAVYGYVFCADAETKAGLKKALHEEKLPKLLAGIVTYLGDKKFFGGDKPNAADFAVFAMVEAAGSYDVDVTGYPTLIAHQAAVKALPELSAYFKKREEIEAAAKTA